MLVYERSFEFQSSRDLIWGALTSLETVADWAPWMRNLRVHGEDVSPGTILTFDVVSPLRIRLTLEIEITATKERESIEAAVRRDLQGAGRVEMRDTTAGTEVLLAWNVEPVSKPLRTLLRFSGPLVRWSQDWAVRSAVAGARQRLQG